MPKTNPDFVIVGSGMVGLSLAHQLLERYPDSSVVCIDKEHKVGMHSSGRNSGVLHAGIYYPPNTLKARVCVEGANRLHSWCQSQEIPVLRCGKVVSPQTEELDPQLDLLLQRGTANGAKVELIDTSQFRKLVPHGRTASGRALWSPNTCVVNPKQVIERLQNVLFARGVSFYFGVSKSIFKPSSKTLQIQTSSGNTVCLSYSHLFNTAGLQADRVAHQFGIAHNFSLLPFKGIYWQIHPEANLDFRTNLYPVPDLNVPFLGVHVTPSPTGIVSLGPTAIPAWGRENYRGIHGIEPLMACQFLSVLAGQWFSNSGGFRRYAVEQGLHGLKPLFLKAAQALVPELRQQHLVPSNKVGLRAQLFNHSNNTMVQDFILKSTDSSTHVLNAISPAFTASFALADLIIDKSPHAFL